MGISWFGIVLRFVRRILVNREVGKEWIQMNRERIIGRVAQ